jgi:hypothetical protein
MPHLPSSAVRALLLAVLSGLGVAQAGPPTETLAGFFGVNEAVVVPPDLLSRTALSASDERAALSFAATTTTGLGAGVVRAHSANYPGLSLFEFKRQDWKFHRADRYFQAVSEAGLDTVVVLGPWPARESILQTDHYLPADLELYVSYVRGFVERYNADGVGDMPGEHRPVLAWEIDTEPDRNHLVAPEGYKGRLSKAAFETPAEYAQLVLLSAGAIRGVDPKATVLLGGMHELHTKEGRAYLQAVLAVPGVLDAVDVISVHAYTEDEDGEAVLEAVEVARKAAPGKPIWVTQMGVPTEGKGRWVDPRWQGAMVVNLYSKLLLAGVERVFWHGLVDPQAPGRGVAAERYQTHGLVVRAAKTGLPHVRKPAGFAYQGLARELAGLRRDQVAEEPIDGGRMLHAGEAWLAFEGTVAVPPRVACVQDLLTGEVGQPGETATAPAWMFQMPRCVELQK